MAFSLPETRKTASAPQSRGVHGPRVPGLNACGPQPRGSLQRRAGPTSVDGWEYRLHAIASCLCFLPFFLTSRLLRSVTLASQHYDTANAAFNSNRNDCFTALKFATAQFQSNFHQKRLLLRLPPASTSIHFIASRCCSVPSRLPYRAFHSFSLVISSVIQSCLCVLDHASHDFIDFLHPPPRKMSYIRIPGNRLADGQGDLRDYPSHHEDGSSHNLAPPSPAFRRPPGSLSANQSDQYSDDGELTCSLSPARLLTLRFFP